MGKKIGNFIKEYWNYIVAFLIPWLLIVIHSLVSQSWLTGNGSILAGDMGTVYYQLYAELWDKVHQGGSLFYTWNAGLGTDFLVQVFQYLLSPFTLVIMLVPKNNIENVMQFIMVLRWSLAALTMTYYFMHTQCNKLAHRRKLLSMVLASCYFLGNAVIDGMAHMNCEDIFVLFPLALLLTENLQAGRGYKRCYLCLTAMLILNFRLGIPVFIFLAVWYAMQREPLPDNEKRRIAPAVCCFAASLLTSMVVILPCAAMTVQGTKLYSGMGAGSYVREVLLSFVDFIQRFYVCDTLNYAQAGQPMLYVSVTALAVALLYLGIPVGKKKKVVSVVLLVFLIAGVGIGGGNLLWHAYAAVGYYTADIAFLLCFLILYMAMEVLQNLDKLKKINIFVVMAAGACVFAYVFFRIEVYLNFYVYLATLLLYVFILLLLFFYCRKSIKYRNILVVFSLLCMAELLANAYIQLGNYNMYNIRESYYHESSEILAENAKPAAGERIAGIQITDNYGMVYGKPSAAGQLAYTNENIQTLFRQLGMAGTQDSYGYFGGSPLLNLMFHIRYGMGQNEAAFSDVVKKGEHEGYNLYEMERLAGLGYMADKGITEWNPEQSSPFEAQNAFVKLAAGEEEGIFETVKPEEFTCESLLGGSRMGHESEHEEHDHSEDDAEAESPVTVIDYDESGQRYQYAFRKMYVEDYVTAKFKSDGTSDYYIYINSEEPAEFSLMVGDELLYADLLSGNDKTFHIGVVEQGKEISIITNAMVDDLAMDKLSFQIAAFQEDVYNRVYEKLSRNSLDIEEYGDNGIIGNINAEQGEIMLTSIPASEGWSVYVDDTPAEYEKIGKALIGVPLEQGKHQVRLRYKTPYLITGAAFSMIGIIIFVIGVLLAGRKTKMEA